MGFVTDCAVNSVTFRYNISVEYQGIMRPFCFSMLPFAGSVGIPRTISQQRHEGQRGLPPPAPRGRLPNSPPMPKMGQSSDTLSDSLSPVSLCSTRETIGLANIFYCNPAPVREGIACHSQRPFIKNYYITIG